MGVERPNGWLQRFRMGTWRFVDSGMSRLNRWRGASLEPVDCPGLISESFEMFLANLKIHTGGEYHSLMLTSPAPGEGKSVTAANLAVTLMRHKLSVLLVDADLRRPALHKIFRLSNDTGLSDVLNGEAEIDRVIQQTPEGLKVLSSGAPPDDPSVLVSSDRMKELIVDLTRRYQITLFDTPPVLGVTDASLLAPLLDWIVLVLSARTTRMEEAKRARVMLESANGKVLGSILNRFDARFAPGYYRHMRYYADLASEK